jgi:hypothetical protein
MITTCPAAAQRATPRSPQSKSMDLRGTWPLKAPSRNAPPSGSSRSG